MWKIFGYIVAQPIMGAFIFPITHSNLMPRDYQRRARRNDVSVNILWEIRYLFQKKIIFSSGDEKRSWRLHYHPPPLLTAGNL